jgi:hypothetical protein
MGGNHMKRKTAYVCSPYRGDIENNIEYAKKAGKFVYNRGYAPIVPHLMLPNFLEDNDDWMSCGLAILDKCDELWVFTDNGITAGMREEIDHFSLGEHALKVFYLNEEE